MSAGASYMLIISLLPVLNSTAILFLVQWVSNVSILQNHLESLVKQISGPYPQGC